MEANYRFTLSVGLYLDITTRDKPDLGEDLCTVKVRYRGETRSQEVDPQELLTDLKQVVDALERVL